jgi:hypothetical protein
VGIPRTLRDFQARRESRLYDFSSERLFHRPARCRIGRLEGGTLRGISSQAMWSVGQAQSSIQVLMHHHRAARQRGSPAHPPDLQAEILKAHRVVTVYAAFELEREDGLRIAVPAGHKSVSRLRGHHLKTAVELRHLVLAQKLVGGL